jgi:creatinine amidohydrolase/Fe(II)-dependent formamide hydrolase-like protein
VWSETGPLRYERLTWPEVRRAAAEDRVALVPVATLEDHGPHLPVDTDLRIVAEICERAAARAADRVVLLPAIPHGYDPHHMDFPGAITIGWETFVRYCADVGRSLAHHGFRRMLFLNGHGSNQNLVETAARLDWSDGPLKLMPWWSSFSRSGVQGDATLGTAEKGQALLEAAVDECLAYVDELLAKPLPERRRPTAGAESHPERRPPVAGAGADPTQEPPGDHPGAGAALRPTTKKVARAR